jgi:hypothetical protein
MTEAEWLECTDPKPMLDFLRDKASDRKLRLFACAACRRYWYVLRDVRSRNAVVVAERFVDGLASVEELESAQEESRWPGKWEGDGLGPAVCCYFRQNEAFPPSAAQEAVDQMLMVVEDECFDGKMPVEKSSEENLILADLLRDIIGNPFGPVTLDPTWLTPKVKATAQKIYDDRAFDRLPILADSLVESGCDNAEILSHLHGPGPHVKGCWALDLILEKA